MRKVEGKNREGGGETGQTPCNHGLPPKRWGLRSKTTQIELYNNKIVISITIIIAIIIIIIMMKVINTATIIF